MALTIIQSQSVIEALLLAKKWSHEMSTMEEDETIAKAIKYVLAAMKDGMPIGQYEEECEEESEPDQKPWAMRKAYGGR